MWNGDSATIVVRGAAWWLNLSRRRRRQRRAAVTPVPLDIAPSELRVEHLGSGILGLGVRAPRLSWRLPDRVTRQEVYQIEINGKPSPRVVSDACVLVPWPGEPVASRQNVSWRVRLWSEQGREPLVSCRVVRSGPPGGE